MTPKQMLRLGVFGGKYMTDCEAEFPNDWFEKARLCHERHDPELNFFGVNASQPLSVWREKGWIYHEDPRGWFQWYCRYYLGRRCPDDERQVKRWCTVRRHIAQLKELPARRSRLLPESNARPCFTGPTTLVKFSRRTVDRPAR